MSAPATPRFCCWCGAALTGAASSLVDAGTGDDLGTFRVDCGSCGLSTYGTDNDGERAADIAHPENRRPDVSCIRRAQSILEVFARQAHPVDRAEYARIVAALEQVVEMLGEQKTIGGVA